MTPFVKHLARSFAKLGHNCSMIEAPQLATGNPQLQKAMDNIVKAENIKVAKIDERLGKEKSQLDLIRDLKNRFLEIKTSLDPFKKVSDFRELVGQSSDPGVLDARVDKSVAKPGSYELEVISLARTDSVMSYGFRDRNKSEVGVGYIKINLPEGGTKNIYINSENNTLDGVAEAINSSGTNVRAYVVNDGTDSSTPWRLVISGEKTGWREDFEYPEFYMLDGDLDLDVEYNRDAASAKIKFNGQPLYVDKNNISDLIPGVSIDLKSAKPGQTVTLEVKPDIEKIEEKAVNFVQKINGVLGFIQQQNQMKDPNSPEANRKQPRLSGDTTLLGVESRLRDLVQKSVNPMGGEIQRLRDVGITFNRNGTLEFDSKKFQTKLESNFDEVAELFSGNGAVAGFANEMVQVIDGVTRSGDGTLSIRERGVQDRVSQSERRRDMEVERAERRVQKSRENLARAETAIEKLQGLNGAFANLGQGG